MPRQSLRDKQLQTSRVIDENIKLREENEGLKASLKRSKEEINMWSVREDRLYQQLMSLRQAAADLVGSRSLLSKTHCRQDEFAARIEALLEETAP